MTAPAGIPLPSISSGPSNAESFLESGGLTGAPFYFKSNEETLLSQVGPIVIAGLVVWLIMRR